MAEEECNDTGTFVITFLAIMLFLAVVLLSKAGLVRLPVCACCSRLQGKSTRGGPGDRAGGVGLGAGAGAGVTVVTVVAVPNTAPTQRAEGGPVQHSRRLGRCDARFVSLFLYYFQVSVGWGRAANAAPCATALSSVLGEQGRGELGTFVFVFGSPRAASDLRAILCCWHHTDAAKSGHLPSPDHLLDLSCLRWCWGHRGGLYSPCPVVRATMSDGSGPMRTCAACLMHRLYAAVLPCARCVCLSV